MDATAEQARVCAALNRWARARGRARCADDPELLAARVDLVRSLEEAGWQRPAHVAVGPGQQEQQLRHDGAPPA